MMLVIHLSAVSDKLYCYREVELDSGNAQNDTIIWQKCSFLIMKFSCSPLVCHCIY